MFVPLKVNVPEPLLERAPDPFPITPEIVVLPAPLTINSILPLVMFPLIVNVPASLSILLVAVDKVIGPW